MSAREKHRRSDSQRTPDSRVKHAYSSSGRRYTRSAWCALNWRKLRDEKKCSTVFLRIRQRQVGVENLSELAYCLAVEKVFQRATASALLFCGLPTPEVQAHSKHTGRTGEIELSLESARETSAHQSGGKSTTLADSIGETPAHISVPPDLRPRAELFPLWVELTGTGLGLATFFTGTALRYWSSNENMPPPNTKYLNGKKPGLALMLSGVQLAAVSLAFLAIDHWPRRRYLAPRLSKRIRMDGGFIRF